MQKLSPVITVVVLDRLITMTHHSFPMPVNAASYSRYQIQSPQHYDFMAARDDTIAAAAESTRAYRDRSRERFNGARHVGNFV